MKATIEFNLPDEKTEYAVCNKAQDMFSLLWTIKQDLRDFLKYGHKFKTPNDVIEHIQSIIYDEIDLDELA